MNPLDMRSQVRWTETGLLAEELEFSEYSIGSKGQG